MADIIRIRGARVHNLKNVSLDIPRNKFVVFTGLSGSGKSSLAFDTIYAEGQRRYVESLSAYARQFLGLMDKPDVDQIDGLSPAIAIDQKSVTHNPRSTVGTVTEIYDYLRLLYARVGIPHCPVCGREVQRQTTEQIRKQVLAWPANTPILILAPKVRDMKGEHKHVFAEVRKAGYVRVRLDGIVTPLDEAESLELDKKKKHSIDIVIDRLTLGTELDKQRLTESLEAAGRLGKGLIIVSKLSADGKKGLTPYSVSTTPARTTAPACHPSSRGTSRSTTRTVPAQTAPASARSSRLTPSSLSRTRNFPLPKGPFDHGHGVHRTKPGTCASLRRWRGNKASACACR